MRCPKAATAEAAVPWAAAPFAAGGGVSLFLEEGLCLDAPITLSRSLIMSFASVNLHAFGPLVILCYGGGGFRGGFVTNLAWVGSLLRLGIGERVPWDVARIQVA